MKECKLDSQCYKIKNFFTNNACLVIMPYYSWPLSKKTKFKELIKDCYKKLGGK